MDDRSTLRDTALLTRHHKDRVIGPALAEVGLRVRVTDAFDTDQLGTFTRDVPRAGTQIEAARRKARIGMELLGLSLGVASEGAFGPDPYGVMPWNVEMVVFVDDAEDLVVVGRAHGPARHLHATVSTLDELHRFAQGADFPRHGLVLRVAPDGPPVRGLCEPDALRSAFEALGGGAVPLHVEHDLRAHVHPDRMARIDAAARDLARRLASPCPACGAPGFDRVSWIAGRPCGHCGAPTSLPRAAEWGCVRCDHRVERSVDDEGPADPTWCPLCNP